MVRKLITLDTCDDCIRVGIEDAPAVCNHVLSIDGGPLRRLSLCQRCEIVWRPFIELYEHFGQDQDPPPVADKTSAKGRRVKAVKPRKPKELEKAPEPEDARPPVVAEAPTQEQPKEEKPVKEKPVKEKQYVWCPLPHKSDGKPRGVNYNDRNSHADLLHDHTKLWEIPWQDKYGIFPRGEDGQPLHACDAHAECMKTGLAFTTASGLRTHRNSCPLPRLDEEPAHDS